MGAMRRVTDSVLLRKPHCLGQRGLGMNCAKQSTLFCCDEVRHPPERELELGALRAARGSSGAIAGRAESAISRRLRRHESLDGRHVPSSTISGSQHSRRLDLDLGPACFMSDVRELIGAICVRPSSEPTLAANARLRR